MAETNTWEPAGIHEQAQEHFIQGLARIAQFWGFPKAMGAVFGAVYLSPEPMTLDQLTEAVRVSKGAASTHVRSLERLGMLHKEMRVGDRKDYYTAETDFWAIVKRILKEREKTEFDRAIKSVGQSLEMLDKAEHPTPQDTARARFMEQRLQNMQRFFDSLDRLVALVLALDDLGLGALRKLLGRSSAKKQPTPNRREKS